MRKGGGKSADGLAGADDEGDTAVNRHRSDRHDGDEAGVFGQLREIAGIEELVFLYDYPFRFAVGVLSQTGHPDRASEKGEHQPEEENHQEQPSLLEAKGWTAGRLFAPVG